MDLIVRIDQRASASANMSVASNLLLSPYPHPPFPHQETPLPPHVLCKQIGIDSNGNGNGDSGNSNDIEQEQYQSQPQQHQLTRDEKVNVNVNQNVNLRILIIDMNSFILEK